MLIKTAITLANLFFQLIFLILINFNLSSSYYRRLNWKYHHLFYEGIELLNGFKNRYFLSYCQLLCFLLPTIY